MSELVFVYGTLKQGHYNNGVFPSGSELVSEAVTKPEFTMVDLGAFPGVVHEGGTVMQGEVWKVDSLENLDMLEGNGSFYTREKRPIFLKGDKEVEAWIYMLPVSYLNDATVVETGVW